MKKYFEEPIKIGMCLKLTTSKCIHMSFAGVRGDDEKVIEHYDIENISGENAYLRNRVTGALTKYKKSHVPFLFELDEDEEDE